ncbi:MAG TPA: hypothetical protein VNX28_03575, partial [Gemmataceae bacterium]|nr:hypothetical protein [Gemmataceae bacterium]
MHLGRAVLLLAWLMALDIPTTGNGQTPGASEEQLLKSAGVATDNASLLQFLRRRPFQDALGKSAPEQVAAAARLLAARRAPGTIEVLFNLLP